ncbi:DUF6090 family protein [Flagellimonas sp. DF-77]|uniref:DUF6090 family protein n=1 Tax=Flagellimonas algarum TaxID=3230298 RepID=UPI0033980AD5
MIKFFRRIRKRLFAENNFSKYLMYAVGEIILVMIGILLALQANNWNVERTAKRELEQSLSKLLVELNQDKIHLNAVMSQNASYESMLDSCLMILKNPKDHTLEKFDDFFRYTNYTISFEYSSESFDELSKQGKLKLISNDQLVDSLISYYGNSNHKGIEEAMVNHTRDNLRVYTTGFDFLNSIDDLDNYKAADFGITRKKLEDYRNDVRIINGIRFKLVLHKYIELAYKEILPRIDFLIKFIEEELDDEKL